MTDSSLDQTPVYDYQDEEPATLIRCPGCKGTGQEKCCECEGSGKREITPIGPSMYRIVRCTWCKGEGGHKCHVCWGAKMVTRERARLHALYVFAKTPIPAAI